MSNRLYAARLRRIAADMRVEADITKDSTRATALRVAADVLTDSSSDYVLVPFPYPERLAAISARGGGHHSDKA